MGVNLVKNIIDNDSVVFISYGGIITQIVIRSMINALEEELKNGSLLMEELNTISLIFIELTQNIKQYTKENCKEKSLIMISISADGDYYLHSQNVISLHSKNIVDRRLQEISKLNKEEIKLKYIENRRDATKSNNPGCGLGFLEIAKKSQGIYCSFEETNEDEYYCNIYVKVTINREL
jgi:hypothetical protein